VPLFRTTPEDVFDGADKTKDEEEGVAFRIILISVINCLVTRLVRTFSASRIISTFKIGGIPLMIFGRPAVRFLIASVSRMGTSDLRTWMKLSTKEAATLRLKSPWRVNLYAG
jgi:hypothetical protein